LTNDEEAQRAAVIAAARGWLGTPYHPAASVRGVGCDCLTFPAAVYSQAGVIPAQTIPYYPPDWHLHRGDERYLEGVLKIAAEVSVPRPGDFVLWRIGRALAHGAIVIAWPRIIHAVQGIGVMEDADTPINLRFDRREGVREHHFYSPWAKGRRP
jgi:NlpC/P60 family putative phage cell wall peptidase